MPAKDPGIDISLEGVGVSAQKKRSPVDIPLGKTGRSGAGDIGDAQLEQMVNRHHQEVKKQHRRARQGG